MLAAIRVPLKLALPVATVPTIVPLILLAVILPVTDIVFPVKLVALATVPKMLLAVTLPLVLIVLFEFMANAVVRVLKTLPLKLNPAAFRLPLTDTRVPV